MKNINVKYKVGDMNNVERLSPQLKLLVIAINLVKYKVDNDYECIRSAVFMKWSELCKSKDNVKVFASHIHSFIVFGYLIKLTIAKVVTKDEVINMFNKLNEVEKLELLKLM